MSRRNIGIRVTIISAISTLIIALISFLRIPLIINQYGSEQNGIMQVAVQLSAYLILLESGMTSAYQYKMYSNIRSHNIQKLINLYFGLKYNMKQIGFKMLSISFVFIISYPMLVNRSNITYLETIMILVAIMLRYIAPYFLILPQRGLIGAFEKQYLDDLIQLIFNCIIFAFEFTLIKLFKPPLFFVLLSSLTFIIISSIVYNIIVENILEIRKYPVEELDMTPKNMTKDIFLHQLSSIVFYSTDNIVLSILRNLNEVTIYSSFNTLINFPIQFINKIIGGLKSSLALKIQGNDENIYEVFCELVSVSSFVASIIIPIFYLMSNNFISLWIGPAFVVNEYTVLLFSLIILNRMLMPIIVAARDSKALYSESKKFTIFQSILNILLSISLVTKYGINGILIGTVVSMYIIAMPFNIRLVNKNVFHKKIQINKEFIKIILISTLMLAVSKRFNHLELNWTNFIKESTLLIIINFLISIVVFILIDKQFKHFLHRFILTNRKGRV